MLVIRSLLALLIYDTCLKRARQVIIASSTYTHCYARTLNTTTSSFIFPFFLLRMSSSPSFIPVPPDRVSILGPRSVTLTSEDSEVTLTCASGPSNPATKLRFVVIQKQREEETTYEVVIVTDDVALIDNNNGLRKFDLYGLLLDQPFGRGCGLRPGSPGAVVRVLERPQL